MSHTPGPWCIHDGTDIWAQRHGGPCEEWGHGERIASLKDGFGPRLYRGEDFPDTEPYDGIDVRFPEAEANARLIAAAPDLLAACRMALEVLGAPMEGACDKSTACDDCARAYAIADAIRLATGGDA